MTQLNDILTAIRALAFLGLFVTAALCAIAFYLHVIARKMDELSETNRALWRIWREYHDAREHHRDGQEVQP